MAQGTTLVSKILKVSPSIRVATVCDLNGKVVSTAHAKSVKNVLSASESRESLRNAARAWKGRKALSRKLGKCKYVIAEFDRVKRITLASGKNHLIYITTSTKADHNRIIRRVRSFR